MRNFFIFLNTKNNILDKPIFFARKLSPIFYLKTINQIDETVFGSYAQSMNIYLHIDLEYFFCLIFFII